MEDNKGTWGMTKSKVRVMKFVLKGNQNVQGRRKSHTNLQSCVCMCVQVGGGGAQWATASRLLSFPWLLGEEGFLR